MARVCINLTAQMHKFPIYLFFIQISHEYMFLRAFSYFHMNYCFLSSFSAVQLKRVISDVCSQFLEFKKKMNLKIPSQFYITIGILGKHQNYKTLICIIQQFLNDMRSLHVDFFALLVKKKKLSRVLFTESLVKTELMNFLFI